MTWTSSRAASVPVFVLVYLVLLILLVEASLRAYFAVFHEGEFLRPSRMVRQAYPELEQIAPPAADLDILLLGGSVLVERIGGIPSRLKKDLAEEGVTDFRVVNLSGLAHTTRDSYLKLRPLGDRRFDVVVAYHGINEVRANNCPPDLYRADYSHYAWYEMRNLTDRHLPTMDLSVIPFSFDFLFHRARQVLLEPRYVPPHAPEREWLRYGSDIKTMGAFRANLEEIVSRTTRNDAAPILMTFAYYVPAAYSLSAFSSGDLDYASSTDRSPIEIWGHPRNVVAGIEAHNAVVRYLAARHPEAAFIDMEESIPKQGVYFSDICHLSERGSDRFAAVLAARIAAIWRQRRGH